jgi:hypothetical protein
MLCSHFVEKLARIANIRRWDFTVYTRDFYVCQRK